MTDAVLLERRGAVATITLNRPDRLNAFNADQHAAMRAALDEIEAATDVRAVILTGAGRAFCSGQDLSERKFEPGKPPDLGATLDVNFNPMVRRLRAFPAPVIAAVNGTAAGAGANLALACDFVLAARSAKFIQSFARIGLVPDCGGTWLLPRLVGDARARALMMLGDPIDAGTAESWGLIWKAVDDDALRDEAAALAEELAQRPTRALALIKQALAGSGDATLDAQLDVERDTQREAGRTDDYREGVTAFMAKRTPKFEER